MIQAERNKGRFARLLGARKMWLRLRVQGHDVARCTVERLFRQLGISGITRAKTPRTTIPDQKAERPTDLVDRAFAASRPNQLWCADFTYVPTWERMVLFYVAFRLRRVLPPDPGLAGGHLDDHRPGVGHPGDGDLDPP